VYSFGWRNDFDKVEQGLDYCLFKSNCQLNLIVAWGWTKRVSCCFVADSIFDLVGTRDSIAVKLMMIGSKDTKKLFEDSND
jgi:hypothetical protein